MSARQPITTSLSYQQGNSDKVYKVSLAAEGSGFVVNFSYGRRGSTLSVGMKTPQPVTYSEAFSVYSSLVEEKVRKGYREEIGTGRAVPVPVAKAQQFSGLLPHLLYAATEQEMKALLVNDAWGLQAKHDGQRLMVKRTPDGAVIASNRLGFVCTIPQVIVNDLLATGIDDIELDGELIGERFFLFDILRYQGKSVEQSSFLLRYNLYQSLSFSGSVIQVDMAIGTTEKTALFDQVLRSGGEGVVAKRLTSKYEPGKPTSLVSQAKFKFTESSTCIVEKINGDKRSVSLMMLDDSNTIINVGNVTVPVNQPMPAPEDLVEVRYMHRFEAGSLYQPVLLGIRTDVERRECVVSQITRIKQKEAVAEAVTVY